MSNDNPVIIALGECSRQTSRHRRSFIDDDCTAPGMELVPGSRVCRHVRVQSAVLVIHDDDGAGYANAVGVEVATQTKPRERN